MSAQQPKEIKYCVPYDLPDANGYRYRHVWLPKDVLFQGQAIVGKCKNKNCIPEHAKVQQITFINVNNVTCKRTHVQSNKASSIHARQTPMQPKQSNNSRINHSSHSTIQHSGSIHASMQWPSCIPARTFASACKKQVACIVIKLVLFFGGSWGSICEVP